MFISRQGKRAEHVTRAILGELMPAPATASEPFLPDNPSSVADLPEKDNHLDCGSSASGDSLGYFEGEEGEGLGDVPSDASPHQNSKATGEIRGLFSSLCPS